MQSQTPEAATSLTRNNPCSPCCLHAGRRRCVIYRACARAALYQTRQQPLVCFFLCTPTLVVNCASLWLLPAPSGVGTIARGNIGKSSRLETLCIAAKRCSRRSIPDSRRIHHPPMSYTPATSSCVTIRVMPPARHSLATLHRAAATRNLEPASVGELCEPLPFRARGAISLRPRLCVLIIPFGQHLEGLGCCPVPFGHKP